MTAKRRRPIRWDIHEEHLDEAAFLWGAWEAALEAAIYSLPEVASGAEERLMAHLDGLVLGGNAVAEKLLLPALQAADLGPVRPATWALLQADEGDHFDAVLEALAGAEPPKAAAITRAMGLSRHPTIVDRLSALWTHGAPPLRAVILDVIARQNLAWASTKVPEALRAKDPMLLAVALGLVRRLPDRDPAFAWDVDAGLEHADPRVRREALATAFILGSKRMGSAARDAIAAPEAGRLPFALLSLSPEEADRQVVRSCLEDPATVRHSLWALGFAGDVASIEVLLRFLPDQKLGRLAADAFSTITGLVIGGPFRAAGVSRGPELDEVGPDDPPPEVRPEDALPLPVTAAVKDWWGKNRGRFQPRQRYLWGEPRTVARVRAAMDGGPMWRRSVWALQIAAETRGATVDLTGWTGSKGGG